MAKICEDWNNLFSEEIGKEYMTKLRAYIAKEREESNVYPAPSETFNAFSYCNYKEVKVVILGADPYCIQGAADGLAFSSGNVRRPPALAEIFKEAYVDYFSHNCKVDMFDTCYRSNSLTGWASQGVLLLNTVLTVREGKAGSHKNKGWERFSKAVIGKLNDHPNRIVYLLWGKWAQGFAKLVDTTRHFILEADHPLKGEYALSDFGGCKHFSQANKLLKKHGETQRARLAINWGLF